jgi:hypothetical protein
MSASRCSKCYYTLEVALHTGFALFGQYLVQLSTLYPSQKVANIINNLRYIDLRAKSMVWHNYDPASIQTVLDLIFVDHARMAEHESTAMYIDD